MTFHRLERIISNRGLGSRKDVLKILKQGRVSVNGRTIRKGSEKFSEDILLEVDGLPLDKIPLLAVYNKPHGIHCTMKDPWGRKSLENLSLQYPFLKTMHPVGRLDTDTSGLILFSSNGFLTNILLNPINLIIREYVAEVLGNVIFLQLSTILKNGVETTEGKFPAQLIDSLPSADFHILKNAKSSEWTTANAANIFTKEQSSNLSLNIDRKSDDQLTVKSIVRLTVTEGKYRMVRRILHNSGHSVCQLHRTSYGNICLDGLEEGLVRRATPLETLWATDLLMKKQSPYESED